MNSPEANTKEGILQKEYEISMLLATEGTLDAAQSVLGQHGIEIKSGGQLKKIALAYPIHKAIQAYFVFFRVSALPESVKLLEAQLKSGSLALRSLIVLLPKIKPPREREDDLRRAPRVFARRPAPASYDSEVPKTLSNEALEKKIEEILQ